MDFRRQATHTQSHRQRAASVCKNGEKGWRGFHILQFVLLLPVTMSLRSKAQIMQFACNFCIRRDWTNETKRNGWIEFSSFLLFATSPIIQTMQLRIALLCFDGKLIFTRLNWSAMRNRILTFARAYASIFQILENSSQCRTCKTTHRFANKLPETIILSEWMLAHIMRIFNAF